MSENNFTILLLSDSHISTPSSLDSENVFDPLFEDLKKFFDKGYLPSLIIFSGDLANTGKAEEYIEAENFLKNISNCFEKEYGEIPILLVPGNHDVDRDVIDDPQKKYRENLTVSIVKEMMEKNNVTWKNIIKRQANWLNFVKSVPKQTWELDPVTNLCTGIIDAGGKKIGIAGLNSSWASHEKKEQGAIWIGEHQISLAHSKLKDADLQIAIAHHPIDWLNPEDKTIIRQKVESKFHIFCHGHEHAQWFTDSQRHLKCEVGACYEGIKDKNTYSWLNIDILKKDATIWLREYTNQGEGGWRANHIPGKTDKEGKSDLYFLKNQHVPDKDDSSKTTVGKNKKTRIDESFPDNIEDFLKILEDRFFFRLEKGNLTQNPQAPLIYWPVRLRHPTPIHAAQCFVAAGLQKLGCHISLWIDDLGRKEYSIEQFSDALKQWLTKVGGDGATLKVNKFSDIIYDNGSEQYTDHAWDMLQKWLGNMSYYTDAILRISKIWPSSEDSKEIINEIKKTPTASSYDSINGVDLYVSFT